MYVPFVQRLFLLACAASYYYDFSNLSTSALMYLGIMCSSASVEWTPGNALFFNFYGLGFFLISYVNGPGSGVAYETTAEVALATCFGAVPSILFNAYPLYDEHLKIFSPVPEGLLGVFIFYLVTTIGWASPAALIYFSPLIVFFFFVLVDFFIELCLVFIKAHLTATASMVIG